MAGPIPFEMEPMLAAVQAEMPVGEDWSYEPKWDGFRIVAHRRGEEVHLISRGNRPMTRYFPELPAAFRALPADGVVFDGELVVMTDRGLDFDALQMRLHPAESRVRLLAARTPAAYVAFDLLAAGDQDLRPLPLGQRRARLEALLEGVAAPIHLTPYTRDPERGRAWFEQFEGAGLDGIIAKQWSKPYLPGRRGWVKLKHSRSADCVVVGYRLSSDRTTLGAVLLGLYDGDGNLHYVGHTSAFSQKERREVLEMLQPLREESPPGAMEMGRMPGGPSRWSRGRATEWVSCRPELVCEVTYDKLQSGRRFRHAAGFLRWRGDRDPRSCGFGQVVSVAGFDVDRILGRDRGPV